MTAPPRFFNFDDPCPQYAPKPVDQALEQRIDKLIEFSARNGPAFVDMIRQKQRDNSEYAFLYDGVGSDYFKWKLYCYIYKVDAGQPLVLQAGNLPPHKLDMSTISTHTHQTGRFTSPKIEEEFQTLLSNLTGSRQSIKEGKEWICSHLNDISGIVKAMAHHQAKLTEYEKQLHVIYLANDVLLKCVQMTSDENATLGHHVLRTFYQELPQMTKSAYSISNQSSEACERLTTILDNWSFRKVYSQNEVDNLKTYISVGVAPKAMAFPPNPAPQNSAMSNPTNVNFRPMPSAPGPPYTGFQRPPAPCQVRYEPGAPPCHAFSVPGAIPSGFVPHHHAFSVNRPGMHFPTAPPVPNLSIHHPPGNPGPPYVAHNPSANFPPPSIGPNGVVPPQFPTPMTHNMGQVGPVSNVGWSQPAPFHMLTPGPPIETASIDPLIVTDPNSFPPGLLPKLVKEHLKSEEAYVPLYKRDIEKAGIPGPRNPDKYMLAKLDKFYSELMNYRVGTCRADMEDEPHTRRHASNYKDRKYDRLRQNKNDDLDDGSFKGEQTERGAGPAGLGFQSSFDSELVSSDPFSQYRKKRSGAYHDTIKNSSKKVRAQIPKNVQPNSDCVKVMEVLSHLLSNTHVQGIVENCAEEFLTDIKSNDNVLQESKVAPIKSLPVPCIPSVSNTALSNQIIDLEDDELLADFDVEEAVAKHRQSLALNKISETPTHVTSNLPTQSSINLDICCHGVHYTNCSLRSEHVQEIMSELLEISDKLLDGDVNTEDIPSLQKRRKELVSIKSKLQEAQAQGNTTHTLNVASQPSFAFNNMGNTVTNQKLNYLDPAPSQVLTNRNLNANRESQSFLPKAIFDAPSLEYNIFNSSDHQDHDQASFPRLDRELTLNDANCVQSVGTFDKKWSEIYPWSQQALILLREFFGSKDFRLNQRQAINAIMSNKDVFVLMPTGGGKSLCYQLPALLNGGVTIVISPLVSLIQDQVFHLKQAGIECGYLSGTLAYEDSQETIQNLIHQPPLLKILFVTPEKVAKSDYLLRMLDTLNNNNYLDRIAVDEAHCVSQWGHDFRPDYKSLSIFKNRYPEVPLLALTATATPLVQKDVVDQLNLKECIVFKSSFNRTNLRYEVRHKKANVGLKDMATLIANKFFISGRLACGIVYCLSRNDCEKVALELQKALQEKMRRRDVLVRHYHANMSVEEREKTQYDWTHGKVQIIAATIAFGMGINKPDVRFVIHYSIPKSLEGYHQETGRAGRDGKPASCILYYSYQDSMKMRFMITESAKVNNTSNDQQQKNVQSINKMVDYCEELVECRRFVIMKYFGESFTRQQCNNTCDNCLKRTSKTYEIKDMTVVTYTIQAAKDMIDVIKTTGEKHSMTHILDIFRGSNTKTVRQHHHEKLPCFGVGKHLGKEIATRLIRRLVIENVLLEDITRRNDQYAGLLTKLRINYNMLQQVNNGRKTILLQVLKTNEDSKKSKRVNKQVYQINDDSGDDGIDDVSVPSIMDADDINVDPWENRLRELGRQALSQLNAHFEVCFNNKRLILEGPVVEHLVKRRPLTMEELHSLDIGNFSKIKRNQYGQDIINAFNQVVNHAEAIKAGLNEVDDHFALNKEVLSVHANAQTNGSIKRPRFNNFGQVANTENMMMQRKEYSNPNDLKGNGPSQSNFQQFTYNN